MDSANIMCLINLSKNFNLYEYLFIVQSMARLHSSECFIWKLILSFV